MKPPGFEEKIIQPGELTRGLARLARPLVFTNGVFDILHRGHATLGRGIPKGHSQNWGSGFLPSIYQGTALKPQGEPIDDMKRSLYDYILKHTFGMTTEEIKKYLESPQTNFDPVLNNPAFFQEAMADKGIAVIERMGFIEKTQAVAMSGLVEQQP